MNGPAIPDYISPIVGYRAWHWNDTGLWSLNGEPWHAGQPLEAGCRASSVGTIVGRAEAAHSAHDAPQMDCTCGICAAKLLEHQRPSGYFSLIHGEVYLWGTVVEHELGWRAQFAYPKALFLSHHRLPFKLAEIQSRLETLIAYRADIFVADPEGNIPLWANDSGYASAGSDYLIKRKMEDYAHRQSVEQIVKRIMAVTPQGRVIVMAPIVRGRKGEFEKEMEKLVQHGFTRVRVDGKMVNLEDEIQLDKHKNHTIEVVIDRLLVKPGIERRLEMSVGLAMKLAGGLVQVSVVGGKEQLFLARLGSII